MPEFVSCFFFLFIISHTAWVIVFKHGNKPSRLDKKVSFVGSWETTYTPFVHRVMGLGHFYRLKWGGRKIDPVQWVPATA